jgi:hypothetical protein
MQEMVANGSTRMRSYGAWIAARYANQKNLVWMMGGDMSSFNSAQQSAEDGLSPDEQDEISIALLTLRMRGK